MPCALRAELAATGLADRQRGFNLTWHDWLNLDNQMTMSRVIAAAAQQRTNSRGSHCRDDHPEAGALETSRFTRVRQTPTGVLDISDEAVRFTHVAPGQTLLLETVTAAE
jgi:fumarate reductase flavoprotein subunit